MSGERKVFRDKAPGSLNLGKVQDTSPMTTQNKTNRKPSHAVYHVRGEGEDGLNISLDYARWGRPPRR